MGNSGKLVGKSNIEKIYMIHINTKEQAKPFIKWVGGKGQLLQQLEKQLPTDLHEEEFTYIEPFVGGGAMLFYMLQNFMNIKQVVINDINRNLTEVYRVIKQEPEGLVHRLKHIEQQYLNITTEDGRKNFYLEMRRRFNEEVLSSLDKSAIFIFLNRTCFNGLYRENAKGKFNVPFGRYANPTICNEEIIYADSELLNRFDVQILNGDFKDTAKAIAEQISNKRTLGCKTLFATHYHELIALEGTLEGVKNYSIAVKKRGEEIKFLRKIVEGGADESYGIEVAKLAGIPSKVTNRAKQILSELEQNTETKPVKESTDQISFSSISHDDIIEKLKKTNIDELTPDDAKYFLGELIDML